MGGQKKEEVDWESREKILIELIETSKKKKSRQIPMDLPCKWRKRQFLCSISNEK